MAKKKQNKENVPQEKITLIQYLTSPEALPNVLLMVAGIAVSVVPTFLSVAQNYSMLLGIVGVILSMTALKNLTDKMPENR